MPRESEGGAGNAEGGLGFWGGGAPGANFLARRRLHKTRRRLVRKFADQTRRVDGHRRPDASGGRKSPTRRVGCAKLHKGCFMSSPQIGDLSQSPDLRVTIRGADPHVIATDRRSESITGPSGPTIGGADPHVIATDRRSESIAGPCGSQNWGHLTFMSSPPRPTDSATATTPRLAPQRSLAFGLSGSLALWLLGSLAP